MGIAIDANDLEPNLKSFQSRSVTSPHALRNVDEGKNPFTSLELLTGLRCSDRRSGPPISGAHAMNAKINRTAAFAFLALFAYAGAAAAEDKMATDSMKSDAMKGDHMKTDHMKGDAMKGDTMKTDGMKGDATKPDAMKGGK
jgi:pentapeptide MXKDX repeat protein